MGNNCCPLPTMPTTLPPSGPAGGDLTGTYPNPQVDPLKVASEVAGNSAAQAALAQALSTALAKYYPPFPSSLPPSGAAGGDLTGTYPNPSVDPQKVAAEVAGSTAAQAALAQALSGSLEKYYPSSLPPSGPAGGGLLGEYPDPTVDPLKLVDAISVNDAAKAALANALCEALTCCIQDAVSGLVSSGGLKSVSYDASTHTFTFTGFDSTTTTINLDDLLPVAVATAGGITGDGTAATPLALGLASPSGGLVLSAAGLAFAPQVATAPTPSTGTDLSTTIVGSRLALMGAPAGWLDIGSGRKLPYWT